MMVNLVKTTPRAFWRLLALLLLLNLLDYAVTVFAFPRLGMTEANGLVAPMLRAPFAWPLLVGKLAIVAALGCWGYAHWTRAPRLIRLFLLLANIVMVLVLAWNGWNGASTIWAHAR